MTICLCLTSCIERNGERLGIGYLEESKNEFFVVIENTKYSVSEVFCFTEHEETIPFHGMLVTAVSYGNGDVKFFAGNVPQQMLEKKTDQTTGAIILALVLLSIVNFIGLLKAQFRCESLQRELWYAKENQKNRESN